MLFVPPRSYESEIMDQEDNSYADLRGAMRDLRLFNRWLGGTRVVLEALHPYLLQVDPARPVEVLDVGTGGGDLPRSMVRYARQLGRELRVTAFDRDPTTARIARQKTRGMAGIRVLCADAMQLPFADASFDLVTVSLFLHHFDEDQIDRLLLSFRRVARQAVLVNDLRRHRVPWAFLHIAGRLTLRHPMVVHDGPLSVLRGFTVDEMHAAAHRNGARDHSVKRCWPYRLLLTLPPLEERSIEKERTSPAVAKA